MLPILFKPLVSISNVAKRMTTLDMTWKCEVNRKDEIGVLAASLNEMSGRLSDAMDSLKAANWKLQRTSSGNGNRKNSVWNFSRLCPMS